MDLINIKISDIKLIYDKDIFQLSRQKHPLNIKERQKYISSIFKELMNKLLKLEPDISLLFQRGSGRCFNNQSQFLRKVVLKCIWLSLNPEIRDMINKEELYLMDNINYLPIYKQIFDILKSFNCYYTCLWFFFQVPNFINYDIIGYRNVYIEMLNYAIDKWNYNCTIKEYINITRGSTFYYNLVYHGISNKILISKWNILLKKIIPDLNYKSLKLNKKKINNKIKICFISEKLLYYTSVFRDRIGIITMLNTNIFDIYIGLYETRIINKESIKIPDTLHPVVHHFLNKFIINNKIILLNKNELSLNRSILERNKFNIIFYPDIGMKQNQTLLSLGRIAPIQVTTWGHSDTSGNENIDYYITSKYFEKINSNEIKKNYSEKIIILPSLSTYYLNPLEIGKNFFNYTSSLFNNNNYEIDNEKINNKKIIIGCMQSFYKFNKNFENTISKIMNLIIPYYDVELYLSNGIPFNKIHINRINKCFYKFKDKIKWFDNLNQKDWLNVIQKCYIMIDPFPFGGCNTSLEAFSLNIPVICIPSNNINGLFTKGFYYKMNFSDSNLYKYLICNNEDEYINNVINIINEKGLYYKIIKEIYNNKNKLFMDKESVNNYEKIFNMFMNKI